MSRPEGTLWSECQGASREPRGGDDEPNESSERWVVLLWEVERNDGRGT